MPVMPKPEHELKRPRKRRGSSEQETLVGTRRPSEMPDPDPEWSEFVKSFYLSAQTSGQADYYQDSDWWMLWNLCEELDVYKRMGYSYIDKETGEEVFVKKRSGQMFQAIMGAMTELLFTEGARRKVRMELQEAPKEPPNLAAVAENVLYPEAFGGTTV